jgi:hypothetical protein
MKENISNNKQNILTNNQIDEIINQVNQKHLDEYKFTQELMNIDWETFSTSSTIKPSIDINMLNDNIFGVIETNINTIKIIIEFIS